MAPRGHRHWLLMVAAVCAVAVVASTLTGCGSSTTSSVVKLDPTSTTTAAPDDTPSTTTTLEPEAGAGTQFYLYTPVTGDCIDRRTIVDGKAVTNRSTPDPDASLSVSGQVIIRFDCERPHQYEVIYTDTTEVAASPPQSQEAFVELAKRVCPQRFREYIGRDYQDSGLEVGWFFPTPDQQAQRIEFLGCLAFDPKGKLTGSVRNSNR
ncbi:MAG: hypothetical protein F2837_08235 [Actinobacteria bacterium]|uniref:Unannotated protein n=1 Tax=freshwater metagenome TaxID=449393 RepID=A0A6J7JVA8_9ZZZZ|nr:hypothetical protein [Actinomycetota bacterium]